MKIYETHSHIVDALNNGEISETIIMASAAGWYVGSVQRDLEDGFIQPYSRDSGYMSKREAEDYWEYIQESEIEDDENESTYTLTYLGDTDERYENPNFSLRSCIYEVSGVQPYQMEGYEKERLEKNLASQIGVTACVVSYGMKALRVFVKTQA